MTDSPKSNKSGKSGRNGNAAKVDKKAQNTAQTMNTRVLAARRPVLLLVGLGLVVMLWTATDYFRTNPGLVVHTAAPTSEVSATRDANSSAGSPNGQDEQDAQDPALGGVMRLMQQLQTNPNDMTALMGLAEHFTHRQDWPKAETFALRAMVAAPAESKPLYLLGVVQHGQGRHAEAAASLEKSLGIKDDPAVRYSLAVLRIHYLDNPAAGKPLLEQALKHPEASPSLKAHLQAELAKLNETQLNETKQKETKKP